MTDGRRRHDGHLMAVPRPDEGGARALPVAVSSSTITRLPSRAARLITSSADQTLPRSMPGKRSCSRQGALEAGAVGLRAGGDDDLIGAEGLDLVGIERRVEQDLDLQLGQLALEPVEIVDDLLAARLQAGQAELAAELVRGFGQRHLMAALGGDARRFQARTPPPTTSTFFGFAAGVKRSPPHSNSRPAEGLIRQEIQ